MTIREERELDNRIKEESKINKERSKMITEQLLKENPSLKNRLYICRLAMALNLVMIAISLFLNVFLDNSPMDYIICLCVFLHLAFAIIHTSNVNALSKNINENEDVVIEECVYEYLNKPAFLLFFSPLPVLSIISSILLVSILCFC